jgi:ADP-ribose pyrophosphatase
MMMVVMGMARRLGMSIGGREARRQSIAGNGRTAHAKWPCGEAAYRLKWHCDAAKENMPAKKLHTAKVLSSKVIYKGAIFGIRRDEVIEPSGVRTTREVITHPGSVVVLPVLADKRIVMIRQYRHAAKQYLWELVAGRIDEGEAPRKAAARELMEETGYRAKRFKVFLDVFPTPGFLEERMYILLAEGLSEGQAQPEDDEKIVAKAFTRKDLEQMLLQGKLRDAKSVAGLLYYFRFLS